MSLKIEHLTVLVEEKEVITDLSLTIPLGEVHALMGPNGSGKSTLALALAGHPKYTVRSGRASLLGQDLIPISPDERAKAGLFLSFQHPQSLPGVKVATFLRLAYNQHRLSRKENPVGVTEFIHELRHYMELLGISNEFASRSVNDGFSGGEKKRLEILQALLLKPKFLILDEVDSGLDMDAIKIVAAGVNYLLQNHQTGVLAITHYKRILQYLIPKQVHILHGGKLIKSGDIELVDELEKTSYDQFAQVVTEYEN